MYFFPLKTFILHILDTILLRFSANVRDFPILYENQGLQFTSLLETIESFPAFIFVDLKTLSFKCTSLEEEITLIS